MEVLFLYLWLFYKDSPGPPLKDNMPVIPRCDVLQGASLGSAGFYEEGNWRHISDKEHHSTEFGIWKKVCVGRGRQ